MEFGAFIRGARQQLRNENGGPLTQRQVGRAIGELIGKPAGVGQTTISSWEAGGPVPEELLPPLGLVLDVPLEVLREKWAATFKPAFPPDTASRLDQIERAVAELQRAVGGQAGEIRELKELFSQSSGRRRSN